MAAKRDCSLVVALNKRGGTKFVHQRSTVRLAQCDDAISQSVVTARDFCFLTSVAIIMCCMTIAQCDESLRTKNTGAPTTLYTQGLRSVAMYSVCGWECELIMGT